MNIFVLDDDIRLNAIYHNDKHVVKMIVEHAQMLSSALRLNGVESDDRIYRKTHVNHPCSIWTRETRSNYLHLINMTRELCREYTYRYGKVHKTESLMSLFEDYSYVIQDGPLTEFALAMPEEIKTHDNVVKSYRDYYMSSKRHIASWKNRDIPSWWE